VGRWAVRCRRGRRLAETRAMSCGDAGGGLRVCPGTVHRSPPARAGGTAGYPPPRLPHRLASGAGTAHAAPGRGSAFGARAGFGRGCNAGFPRAGIRCLGTRIGRVGGEGVSGYRGRESPTARRPHRLAPVGFYCVNTHTHTHTHTPTRNTGSRGVSPCRGASIERTEGRMSRVSVRRDGTGRPEPAWARLQPVATR
jgi:hypothetical protein